ncbi:DsbA family protein [Acidicapsa acidisoli]|uniref:DsbA family protein n=1 Tax=Acidicapsa acidisoli TaxID=1615681 RepID=UPI0021E0D14D|nr:DsbA family protein [Acidicapsa acidisoli]
MFLASSRKAWLAVALALTAAVGCKAQEPAAKSGIADPVLARRIEVMVRSQFNVPAEYDVSLGARTPSKIPGYDSIRITFSHPPHTTTTDFLISADNKSLARLETFDLTKNPAQSIPVDHRPIRGNPDAKVTVISFDDLECPYCARMHQQLFPATLDRYKDKVRFVYKDDPLTEIHPWALHAAVDANCIADQNSGAYWGYVDYLHAHGQDVTGPDRDAQKSAATLDKIAREQGKIFSLDAAKLDVCLQKQDDTAVRASMKEAEALNIDGTPYLFIDGEHINGALPVEQVWMVIDRALRAAGVEPPPPDSPAVTTPTLGK